MIHLKPYCIFQIFLKFIPSIPSVNSSSSRRLQFVSNLRWYLSDATRWRDGALLMRSACLNICSGASNHARFMASLMHDVLPCFFAKIFTAGKGGGKKPCKRWKIGKYEHVKMRAKLTTSSAASQQKGCVCMMDGWMDDGYRLMPDKV